MTDTTHTAQRTVNLPYEIVGAYEAGVIVRLLAKEVQRGGYPTIFLSYGEAERAGIEV